MRAALCLPAASAVPPPALGSAGGAKLYPGSPPFPPPRTGAGKRPRQPPPPHPSHPRPGGAPRCRAAALGRPRGCPAGERPAGKRGFPGAGSARGGEAKQSPWRRAARGKPLKVFSRRRTPRRPALREGCEQDGDVAVRPRSRCVRRRAEGPRCLRGGCAAAPCPGGSLPPGRGGAQPLAALPEPGVSGFVSRRFRKEICNLDLKSV